MIAGMDRHPFGGFVLGYPWREAIDLDWTLLDEVLDTFIGIAVYLHDAFLGLGFGTANKQDGGGRQDDSHVKVPHEDSPKYSELSG